MVMINLLPSDIHLHYIGFEFMDFVLPSKILDWKDSQYETPI